MKGWFSELVSSRPAWLAVAAFFAVVLFGVSLLPDARAGDARERAGVEEAPAAAEDCSSLAADMPSGWKIVMENRRSRGWLQTGEIPAGVEAAREEVVQFMRGKGYACRHVVDEDEGHGQLLLQFEAKGRKVLWSLWRREWNLTGFSWGVSR